MMNPQPQYYNPPRMGYSSTQIQQGGTMQRNPSTSKKKGPPPNSPSDSLSFEENQVVFGVLGPRRQTLSTAIVQFLIPSEDPRKWKLQDVGVLCFVRDSGMKSYFLEIISLRMSRVIFSQEIYDEFGYRKPRARFLTFEGDNFTIGLNFSSEKEILSFQSVLDDKMAAKRQRIALRQSKIFEMQNQTQNPSNFQNNKGGPIPSTPTIQRRTNSYDNRLDFGMQQQPPRQVQLNPTKHLDSKQSTGNRKNNRARNRSKSDKKSKKKGLDKSDIGLPTDFRVVLHAGYNKERGFVVDNFMDDKFSNVFQMAGITDKELEEDKEFILDFIERYDKNAFGSVRGAPKQISNANYPNPTFTPAKQPPPPTITTKISTPTMTNPRPPAVPLRQTQPKQNHGKNVPRKSVSDYFQPTTTLPTPHFQNDVKIEPILLEKHIPAPPPPPPLLIPGGSRIPAPVIAANGRNPNNNVPQPPPPPPALIASNKSSAPPPPPMPSVQPSTFYAETAGDYGQQNMVGAAKPLPPVEDERSALMRQIQEGKKLKKVDVPVNGKGKPGGAMALGESPDSMNGLASALARALAERKGAINPDSGSESEEDGGDVFDDEEWE